MVIGLELFATAFKGLEEQYVLIGGAAADLWFTRAGLEFRATRDLDLVLCVEALESDFVERFWSFVGDGGYQIKERADGTLIKYRFAKPAVSEFPKMLELFAPAPFETPGGQNIVPISVDEEHSSLSGILLDEEYHSVVIGCRKSLRGLTCLTPFGLVLLKARAWLDLTARQTSGEDVDSRHIKKHRNDVFRIAVLLEEGEDPEAPASVLADLDQFLRTIEERKDEWPAIEAACRSLPLSKPAELVKIMRSHFGLLPSG